MHESTWISSREQQPHMTAIVSKQDSNFSVKLLTCSITDEVLPKQEHHCHLFVYRIQNQNSKPDTECQSRAGFPVFIQARHTSLPAVHSSPEFETPQKEASTPVQRWQLQSTQLLSTQRESSQLRSTQQRTAASTRRGWGSGAGGRASQRPARWGAQRPARGCPRAAQEHTTVLSAQKLHTQPSQEGGVKQCMFLTRLHTLLDCSNANEVAVEHDRPPGPNLKSSRRLFLSCPRQHLKAVSVSRKTNTADYNAVLGIWHAPLEQLGIFFLPWH